MSDLDRLTACIDDAKTIEGLQTTTDLKEFFAYSKTNIGLVFGMSAQQVLDRWPDTADRMEKVRSYLLWEYIALNIADLYKTYDAGRDD
ncbi:MAG: hypothetical protein QNJ87_11455 [Gammaproteobacteria bacterium]|nr:hypothetical protein [Gammaproteobacteria bacterium]MDJ0872369.1 hypothetical protein [Gammaproteobacteria bacterium]